eukprot:jgi/Hompol1/2973/HPOL_006265-RA
MDHIILYVTPAEERPDTKFIIDSGLGLSFVMFGLKVVASIAQNTFAQLSLLFTMGTQTIIITGIYDKASRMSPTSAKTFSEGKIINLIDVDANIVTGALASLFSLWSIPIQLVVSTYLLNGLIGVAVWGSLGAFVGVMIILSGMLAFFIKLQFKMLALNDQRIKLIRETLYGMKIVKYRSLEKVFTAAINVIRDKQLSVMIKINVGIVFLIGLLQMLPVTVPIIAFIIYSGLGNTIRTAVVFTALQYFSLLLTPLLQLTQSITILGMGYTSWGRIKSFLVCEESADLEYAPDLESPDAVKFVRINGTTSFCAQQPWILTQTITGNILFGKELDQPRLNRIV